MLPKCLRCGVSLDGHREHGCNDFLYEAAKEIVSKDRFDTMWEQQLSFMQLLQQKRGFPEFPVDLDSKSGQKFIKGLMHECMDELHESLQHLKNSKDHRATEVTGFNRPEFVEELCDSLHYFIEIAIASGVGSDELFEAYINKGEVNRKRILKGY